MNREEKRDSHQGSDDGTLGTGAGSGLVVVLGCGAHVPHNGGAGYNGGLGRGGGHRGGAAVVAAGHASLLG